MAVVAPLTARESEVRALVAAGLRDAEIGTRLGITERTAKAHVSRILLKCGARNRAEIAARAERERADRLAEENHRLRALVTRYMAGHAAWAPRLCGPRCVCPICSEAAVALDAGDETHGQ